MLRQMLTESAQAMGLTLSQDQAEKLAGYHEMLIRANAQFNLTRVPDDLREAADRNYLDCIAPLASVSWPQDARNLIDVGSGAGFPGIPLSIMRPDIHVVLVDSLGKRVNFLQSVIDELDLNAQAMHLRAEDAGRRDELREQFDLAAARAVASLNLLSEYLLPMVRVGGRMLAMKGPQAEEELAQAAFALEELGGRADKVEDVTIPGRDWAHKLVWIDKVQPTPQKYPRKAGVPEKKPLIMTKK